MKFNWLLSNCSCIALKSFHHKIIKKMNTEIAKVDHKPPMLKKFRHRSLKVLTVRCLMISSTFSSLCSIRSFLKLNEKKRKLLNWKHNEKKFEQKKAVLPSVAHFWMLVLLECHLGFHHVGLWVPSLSLPLQEYNLLLPFPVAHNSLGADYTIVRTFDWAISVL